MAQKAITIYTPPTADAHIYAEDEAQHNRARFGGSGITQADGMLACTKVDNNTVKLESGLYCLQGYMLSVSGGTTQNLIIDSGTVGQYRKDLIVAEFTRGGGAVADKLEFKIVKGTQAASESAAADPSLAQNDLSAGGSTRQEPIYRILISGAVLSTITQIAPYVGNFYA